MLTSHLDLRGIQFLSTVADIAIEWCLHFLIAGAHAEHGFAQVVHVNLLVSWDGFSISREN